MSKLSLQGRDVFRDRLSRIGGQTGEGHRTAAPQDFSIQGADQPLAGETPQDLKERIQATLATGPSVSTSIKTGRGRRMIGLPLVVATLGLLVVTLLLRQPAETVTSVITPRANGIFPSFQAGPGGVTGHAGSKTITVSPAADR